MTIQTIATIKSYFETGDRPTQAEFGDLIDTLSSSTIQSYTAPVSGALATTVTNKLSEILSITDFGSAGTTDWLAPMLTCAAVCSGRTVRVPAGRYLVSDRVYWPDCTVEGVGAASVIVMGSAFPQRELFNFRDGGVCRTLSFDGNAQYQDNISVPYIIAGPTVSANPGVFDNIRVYNYNSYGIVGSGGKLTLIEPYVDGIAASAPNYGCGVIFTGSASDNTVIGGQIINNNTGGLVGSGFTRVIGTRFSNNHRQSSPVTGGQLSCYGDAKYMSVIGCHVVSGGGGSSGLELDNCPWEVIGNTVGWNHNWGIVHQGSHNHVIQGNTVTDNGFYGIHLATGSGATVTGNKVTRNLYGIVTGSAANNFVVTGNNLIGNTLGSLVNNVSTSGAFIYRIEGNLADGNYNDAISQPGALKKSFEVPSPDVGGTSTVYEQIRTGSPLVIRWAWGQSLTATSGNFEINNAGATSQFALTKSGSALLGNPSLAVAATDGFVYIPSVVSSPTGTPTTQTGRVPMTFDKGTNKLFVHNGTAWKSVLLS